MKFGKIQQRKFGSSDGAYSKVTDRENFDSQITLTDYEAKLVISHYGHDNIFIGNVGSNREMASKQFRLYPTGKHINLNIVYPKPEKTELRLYISSRADFKPDAGEIWFMFLKEDSLWIGSMPESAWRRESSELKLDETDAIYQESLDETDNIRITKLKERDAYARDRNVAIQRMKLSGFCCEYDPKHSLFISRFNRSPYLEAHHLIPMGLQRDFKSSLDTIKNVYCLCPWCHRAVHHADEKIARDILKVLSEKRHTLNDFGVALSELYSLYAIEQIVR